MEVTTAERYASGGELGELPAPNLVKAFYATVDKLGDDVAIRTQDDSYTISWNDLRDRVHRIAGGLAKLGVKKGDTVALMLNNRPEFIPCDLAAVSLGGDPLLDLPDLLARADPVRLLGRREQGRDRRDDVPGAVQQGAQGAAGDRARDRRRRRRGRPHPRGARGDGPGLRPRRRSSTSSMPDDMLTLIYTSGTTGPPKGVQLTHRNLMALTGGVDEIIDFPERGAKVISWLPAAHIAERGAHYYLPVQPGRHRHDLPRPAQDRRVAGGREADLVLRGAADLREAQGRDRGQASPSCPTSSASPPRRASRPRSRRCAWSRPARRSPRSWPPGSPRPRSRCSPAARSRSGWTRRSRSTRAPRRRPVEVLEFFHAIGIPVGELWGMSETCGVITCNPPEQGQDRHRRAAGPRGRGEAGRGRRGRWSRPRR